MTPEERKVVEEKIQALMDELKPQAYIIAISFTDSDAYYKGEGPDEKMLRMIARIIGEVENPKNKDGYEKSLEQ